MPSPPPKTRLLIRAALIQYLINQPIDPNVGGYYQQSYLPPPGAPPHFAGAGAGGVPLYNEHNEKIPDYTGPTSDAYLPHEKDNTRSAHTFSGMTASDHDLERGVGI